MLQLAKQPRSSMPAPLRSTTRSPYPSVTSTSRPRAAAAPLAPRLRASSSSVAAGCQPDSAASLVWGLKPTDRPIVHAVIGDGAEPPSFKLVRIEFPSLDLLHPQLLTPSPFIEFLGKNLLSKTAARDNIVGLVLSAVYLPSQLDTMRGLAGKQSLETSVQTSVFLDSGSSTMHTVFYRATGDILPALPDSLGFLKPLQPAQLQDAQAVEKRLQQDLRLWDPATWASVLQQRLESKRAYEMYILVDSLMGPPALAAARQLVLKKGLSWIELTPEQLQAASDATSSISSNSSSSGDRRRPAKRGNTTSRKEEQQGGGGDRIWVVISRYAMTAEEAVATVIADLSGGAGGSGNDEPGNGPSWLSDFKSLARLGGFP